MSVFHFIVSVNRYFVIFVEGVCANELTALEGKIWIIHLFISRRTYVEGIHYNLNLYFYCGCSKGLPHLDGSFESLKKFWVINMIIQK